jgi:asparagine N-glycosylation enzyme membrane subunit Stt3
MAEAKWFRQRRWGYSVTPATWQGWAITIAFAVFLLVHAARNGQISALVTALLIVVAVSVVLHFARSLSQADGAGAGGDDQPNQGERR